MQAEDSNEEIFNLVLMCLEELQNTNNAEKITTIFKIKTLSLSGFKPEFDSCVSCAVKINGPSKFSLMLGGLLCPKCANKDFKARSIFRGTIASILYIEKNDFRANLNLGMNQDIKKELDIILNAFLYFHLEKELKSQKVLERLENHIPIIK
jgi:DNA repair protein RecO (recombination protein O)